MAEELIINGETKEELYATLLPQLESLVEDEPDDIANMANIAACIMDTFHFWWVGFYRVLNEDERSAMPLAEQQQGKNEDEKSKRLVLGPFQGPLACTRIRYNKGVCGTAWAKGETIVVPDVDQFPGHIACSSASRSEIVVPLFRGGKVWAVLDIDSADLNTFDDVDRLWLERVAKLFGE